MAWRTRLLSSAQWSKPAGAFFALCSVRFQLAVMLLVSSSHGVLTWMIILKTEPSVSDQTVVSYNPEALLLLNAVCLIASCDAGALFKFASVMHIISYSCRQLLYLHNHC